MSLIRDAARSRTPKLRNIVADSPAPNAHTEAELAALIGLLTAPRSRIRSVAVGHGRDAESRTAAQAFIRAWQALHRDVLAVVDWPEDAASWLRPARRLTAQAPDAWVLAGAPLGVAQLARRLRQSTEWHPARTFGFASLGTPRLVELAGADTVHGLRGASADGGTWDMRHGWTTHYEREQARRIRAGETLRKQTSFADYLAQRTDDPSYTFRQHLRRTGGAIEE
ncbi:hypothetical protein [Streptomyces sp. NPDC059970]|uniref:hypothetical protein n=1 Tax=Streptomyces sp. NPDC059970 TaxID=3347019 RepID=UPI0036A600CC